MSRFPIAALHRRQTAKGKLIARIEAQASAARDRNVRGPPCLSLNTRSLAIARRNQKASNLLRIPAEIRNEIYRYAMDIGDHHLHIDELNWDRLELSRTCHQVFAETASHYQTMKLLPISTIEHHFFYTEYLQSFTLCFLTPSQKRAIRQLSMRWHATIDHHASVCTLKGLKGLRKIILFGGPRMTRSVGNQVKALRDQIGIKDLAIKIEPLGLIRYANQE